MYALRKMHCNKFPKTTIFNQVLQVINVLTLRANMSDICFMLFVCDLTNVIDTKHTFLETFALLDKKYAILTLDPGILVFSRVQMCDPNPDPVTHLDVDHDHDLDI